MPRCLLHFLGFRIQRFGMNNFGYTCDHLIYIYTPYFSHASLIFLPPGYFLGGDLGTILGYAVPCSAVGAVHCRAPGYVDGLLKAPQTGNVWRVRLSAADCLQHSKKITSLISVFIKQILILSCSSPF